MGIRKDVGPMRALLKVKRCRGLYLSVESVSLLIVYSPTTEPVQPQTSNLKTPASSFCQKPGHENNQETSQRYPPSHFLYFPLNV